MMRLLYSATAILGISVLAGCDPTVGGAVSESTRNSPEYKAVSDAAFDVAMSQILADECPIVSVSKSESEAERLVALMLLQNETLDMGRLTGLMDNPSIERQLVADSLRRLLNEPSLDNPAAACTRAQQEIKSGSLIGQLLKRG